MANIETPSDKCSGYGLVDLLKDQEKLVGLEIGCAEGNTSKFLLESLPDLTLFGVDPYVDYMDWNGNDLKNLNNTHQQLMEKINPYKDRHKLFREYSDAAHVNFDDNSLDFVFIDGLHTYDQVKKDCENYYSKVKSGGLFAGHDYYAIEEVRCAVKEFAIKQGMDKIYSTDFDVWYWRKP